MTPAWTLALAIGAPILTLLGVIGVAVIGAWAGRKAANRTAEGAVQNAQTEAYKAADAHWARYNEAMQRWNEFLHGEISKNAQRIDSAEMRSAAAEARAAKSDARFAQAVLYIRRLIRWITDRWPGEEYPPQPSWLDDLDSVVGD